jgi:hypothetical protein
MEARGPWAKCFIKESRLNKDPKHQQGFDLFMISDIVNWLRWLLIFCSCQCHGVRTEVAKEASTDLIGEVAESRAFNVCNICFDLEGHQSWY